MFVLGRFLYMLKTYLHVFFLHTQSFEVLKLEHLPILTTRWQQTPAPSLIYTSSLMPCAACLYSVRAPCLVYIWKSDYRSDLNYFRMYWILATWRHAEPRSVVSEQEALQLKRERRFRKRIVTAQSAHSHRSPNQQLTPVTMEDWQFEREGEDNRSRDIRE